MAAIAGSANGIATGCSLARTICFVDGRVWVISCRTMTYVDTKIVSSDFRLADVYRAYVSSSRHQSTRSSGLHRNQFRQPSWSHTRIQRCETRPKST